MGQFTSYCVECNNKILWFGRPKYGFIKCRNCDAYNSEKELYESLFKDEHYWKLKNRKKKINKILNENSTNN